MNAETAVATEDWARCPRCTHPMDPARATYDDAGVLTCVRCISASATAGVEESLRATDPTTRSRLWSTSVGAFLFGMLSLAFSFAGQLFVFIAPFAAFAGVVTAYRLLRDPTARRNIGAGLPVAVALCVLGGLMGALACVVFVMGLLGP